MRFYLLKKVLTQVFAVSSLCLFSSYGATAQTGWTDQADFRRWLDHMATYECQDRLKESYMRKVVPEILYASMIRLLQINPEVLTPRIRKANHRPLKFTCVETKKTEFGALYDPYWVYIGAGGVHFSFGQGLILLPIEYLNSDQLTNLHPYFKNSVIHEYLHFLGLNNLSIANHNKILNPKIQLKMDDDLVYSCAEVAFPFWSTIKIPKKVSLRKSCFLCTMLTWSKKHRWVFDPTRIQTAKRQCK